MFLETNFNYNRMHANTFSDFLKTILLLYILGDAFNKNVLKSNNI